MSSELLSSSDLALGLVREYLSRKGATNTLAALSAELPAPGPMSRAGLISQTGTASLVRRYKEKGSPLKTLLEVLADWLTQRAQKVSDHGGAIVVGGAPSGTAVVQSASGVKSSPPAVALDLDEAESFVSHGMTAVAVVSAPVPPSVAATALPELRAPVALPPLTVGVKSLAPLAALPSVKIASAHVPAPLAPAMTAAAALSTAPAMAAATSQASRLTPAQARIDAAFAELVIAKPPSAPTDMGQSRNAASAVESLYAHSMPSQQRAPVHRPSAGTEMLVIQDDDDNDGDHAARGGKAASMVPIDVSAPSRPAALAGKTGWGQNSADAAAVGLQRMVGVTAPRHARMPTMEVLEVDDDDDDDSDAHRTTAATAELSSNYQDSNIARVSSLSGALPLHQQPQKQQPPAVAHASRRALVAADNALMRRLIFGAGSNARFSPSWLTQGLCFHDDPIDALRYGLVQYKSGPCGVLAALQAFVLRDLLFFEHDRIADQHDDELFAAWASDERREEALWRACATMLARAACTEGADARGCVTICVPRHAGESRAADLDALDTLQFQLDAAAYDVFDDERVAMAAASAEAMASETAHNSAAEERHLSALVAFMRTHASAAWRAPHGCGCVLLLYSAMLTRGLRALERERDHESMTLIATYGYCGQELVNLLLTGRATSNVFDGEQGLEAGVRLRGVAARAPVGFLAMSEARGDLVVGAHLKSPRAPVWVVFAESHYSVLFSLNASAFGARAVFDLWYYDELAGQSDAQIRLTVDTRGGVAAAGGKKKSKADEIESYVDACILTRWPLAAIDWNGTDKLI